MGVIVVVVLIVLVVGHMQVFTSLQTDDHASIFVPVPVHCPSTGKCGLVPQHVHCHRLITYCSHFLINFQLPTGFVLVG